MYPVLRATVLCICLGFTQQGEGIVHELSVRILNVLVFYCDDNFKNVNIF